MYIMKSIKYRIMFFCFSLRNHLISWFLRLSCYFFSSWYYIDNDSIITPGKVLRLNRIYTCKEGENVDIVRLTNVHLERRYLYCSLITFLKFLFGFYRSFSHFGMIWNKWILKINYICMYKQNCSIFVLRNGKM